MHVNRNLGGDATTQRLARCGIDAAIVLQSTPDQVVILDREWRFVDLNSRAKALIGADRDLVGAIVWEVYPRPPGGVFETACRKVMAERVPIHCEDIYPPHGTWFEYSIHPCGDGIAVYFRDVTANKRQALRESEEQSRQELAEGIYATAPVGSSLSRRKAFPEVLLDSTTYGILALDRDLRFTVWNSAMERFSGVSAAQVIGRIATEALPFIVGTETEAAMHRAVRGGSGILRDQPYDVPETGHRGFFDCEYAPLRDRTDAFAGAVAILNDTTQRRAMEEKLRQAQKMEAVGQLTGGVAHDFNNLLTVMAGNLELIERRAADQDEVRRLIKPTLLAAERGARLIGQLLAFSREQQLRPETVDLRALVRTFENVLQRAVGEAIAFEISADLSLWPCRVDPSQFETALLNLVLNARDAMPDGGTLRIDLRRVELTPETKADLSLGDGRYVAVAVSDTGFGMSLETSQRVFDPFFTTKDVGKGTGLGLSMVYGFVKQSGGDITIESTPASGTKIVLYLPTSDEPEVAHQQGEGDASQMPRGSETIVVAEDDTAVGAVITAMLDDLGYAVLSARTGREAVALLESRDDVGLLLTDVVMPGGMSGVELARETRRLRPDTAVLLTSGYAERVLTAEQARDEFPILPKPLHQASLARTIRALLDKHRTSPG